MLERPGGLPDDYFKGVERGFLGMLHFLTVALGRSLDPSWLRMVEQDIRAEQEVLEERHRVWATDEQAKHQLKLMTFVLANYRIFGRLVPREEVLALVRRAFIDHQRQAILTGVAESLDAASDPFAMMVETSKQREEWFFGPSFAFERQRDDDGAYLLNVRGCFYHRFFEANGAPELTAVFCEWDFNWADAIDPAKHGFRFERPTTLAHGGDMCRFHFYRVGPTEPSEQ